MSNRDVKAEASPVAGDAAGSPKRGAALGQIAWVLWTLAAVPLLMAAHGDGWIYLWTAVAMAGVGAALMGARRLLGRASR